MKFNQNYMPISQVKVTTMLNAIIVGLLLVMILQLSYSNIDQDLFTSTRWFLVAGGLLSSITAMFLLGYTTKALYSIIFVYAGSFMAKFMNFGASDPRFFLTGLQITVGLLVIGTLIQSIFYFNVLRGKATQ